jgi:trans-aconitate methyltransferase
MELPTSCAMIPTFGFRPGKKSTMGTFTELKDSWQSLGSDDPLWAILNDPRAKGGKWSIDEFMQTGRIEIDRVFTWLQNRGPQKIRNGRALDFGCGAGRLTQALGKRFARCTGVDIAPSMVEAARRLDVSSNCDFVVNGRPDLSVFPSGSFDFIYSSIVLQHIPHPYAVNYISEFCRLLAPGGWVTFQIPIHKYVPLGSRMAELKHQITAKIALRTRLRRLLGQPVPPPPSARIEMHVVPKPIVDQRLEAGGVRLIASAFTNSCDPSFNGDLEVSDQPRYYAYYLSCLFAGYKSS